MVLFNVTSPNSLLTFLLLLLSALSGRNDSFVRLKGLSGCCNQVLFFN